MAPSMALIQWQAGCPATSSVPGPGSENHVDHSIVFAGQQRQSGGHAKGPSCDGSWTANMTWRFAGGAGGRVRGLVLGRVISTCVWFASDRLAVIGAGRQAIEEGRRDRSIQVEQVTCVGGAGVCSHSRLPDPATVCGRAAIVWHAWTTP